MVPFFRAVRAKKRGREATPQGGEAPPSMVAKRPSGCRGYPSVRQFSQHKFPVCQQIWTKLGRNDLWDTPDGWRRLVLLSPTRGPSNLARKVKIGAFWAFSMDFDTVVGS